MRATFGAGGQRLRVEAAAGWVDLWVRVQPRASSEGIVGVVDGAIKVRLTAPPVAGRANRALQAFLAGRLGIRRRNVEILTGASSRTKQVRLHGMTAEALMANLGEIP